MFFFSRFSSLEFDHIMLSYASLLLMIVVTYPPEILNSSLNHLLLYNFINYLVRAGMLLS